MAKRKAKTGFVIYYLYFQLIRYPTKTIINFGYFYFGKRTFVLLQDDIIPENVRKTIEEQEKNKEMEDLYLPPRRKNMNQNNADNSKFFPFNSWF